MLHSISRFFPATIILPKLSTETLVRLVVDYPLAINAFAYDTLDEGVHRVAGYFNGLQELMARKDAASSMDAYIKAMEDDDSSDIVRINFAQNIQKYLLTEANA